MKPADRAFVISQINRARFANDKPHEFYGTRRLVTRLSTALPRARPVAAGSSVSVAAAPKSSSATSCRTSNPRSENVPSRR